MAAFSKPSSASAKPERFDAYVTFKNNEAFLFGAQITPLLHASTHVIADPLRTHKLLLNCREIDRLIGEVQQKGHSCVPLALYWSHGRVK